MNTPPVVRYMIVCRDWRSNDDNPQLIDVFGILSTIESLEPPYYPLYCDEICVLLLLSGGRGHGPIRIVCNHEESGLRVFATPLYRISCPSDPLELFLAPFRIRDCPFPKPGAYTLEFWYDGNVLSNQTLVMR